MSRHIAFKISASICLITTALSPLDAKGLGDVINGLGNDVEKVFHPDDGNGRQDHKSNKAGGAVGCGVGGLAGALIGKSTTSKIILGSVLCAVGWKLGSSLKGKDADRLTARSGELLSKDAPQNEAWVAPESHQKILIRTGEARARSKDVPFALDAQVETPANGTIVEAKSYVVVTDRLNFRNSPRTGNNLIGYFDKGDTVEVLGRTADGKWALVGDKGVVVGYAAFRDGGVDLLLTPEQARARRAAVKSASRARPKVVKQAGASLASAKPRVAQSMPVKTTIVRASTECKAVTAQTGGKSDSRTGCALPNGKWAIA